MSKGNVFGKYVVPSKSKASGMWGLREHELNVRSGTWPIGSNDPYFNYVSLLLGNTGVNTTQNNTFLDSSSNNFTITRNGNATQGSFSPYGNLWSNYFDNTAPLRVADSTAFTLGSGSFTVEMWVYSTVAGSSQFFCGQTTDGADANSSFAISKTTSNTINFFLRSNNTTYEAITTATLPLNTWTHIACVRDVNTMRVYLNGVQSATLATTGTVNDSAGTLAVGGLGSYVGLYYSGYISNFRLVVGTCLYPNGTIFAPPTAPLTAVSGTALLTCQSNRFIDNSSNNFTITRAGNTSVQRFSPFAPSDEYSTSVVGGSGYFDGNGDYLTAPANTALVMGTGQFWFEAWIYMTTAPATEYILLGSNDSSFTSSLTVRISPSAIRVDRYGFVAYDSSTITWQYSAWQHIAAGRDSGNTLRFFLNGQAVGTRASTTDNFAGNANAIGGNNPFDSGPNFNGYVAGARLLKGTCLYTSTFTPPSTPLTAITNTSLLANFTNAGIFDNAMMNDLETVGNAQISTSVKKFGTGSIAFDGSGDYLLGPNSLALQMGAGNFTVEMWLYVPTLPSAYKRIFSINNPTISTFNDEGINLEISNTNKMTAGLFSGTTAYSITDANNITTATWTHWALVRNGATLTLYRDGVSVGTSTVSTVSANFTTTFLLYVGRWSADAARDFNGYIDDLRITKGVARYTANFTPPQASLPRR